MSFQITSTAARVKEPTGPTTNTPEDIADFLADIADLAQEAFFTLTMNTRNQVIDRHMVTLGTLNSSLVHPREVFRPAFTDGAAAIVIAHNHPSGDPGPSREDIVITKRLVEAGKTLEIEVLDHVIIGRPAEGRAGYFSMRESGLVSFK